MNKNSVEKLIAEDVLKTSGFINIDRKDVENLRKKSDLIDGIKLVGHSSDLSEMIENAISQVEAEQSRPSKCALIVIKQSTAGELDVEDIMSITEAFSGKSEDFDFVWGVSTDSNLSPGEISLVVLLGFPQ